MNDGDFCDICGVFDDLIYTDEGQLCAACMCPGASSTLDEKIEESIINEQER